MTKTLNLATFILFIPYALLLAASVIPFTIWAVIGLVVASQIEINIPLN